MGPEIAGEEVVQAEPSREVAGWGLHAWVKVGGLRLCQLLVCVSSVRKEGGRGSPAGLGRLCPLGSTLGAGRGQRCGSSRTQETGLCGPWPEGCPGGPQRHKGLLVRPGQELGVGVGEGRLVRRRRAAGGERACWTKPWAHGAYSLHSVACSPRGKAEGTGAAGSGGPGHSGLCSRPLCLLQSLREHLLASRHKALLGLRERPRTTARPPAYCPARPRLWEGESVGAFPGGRNHSF